MLSKGSSVTCYIMQSSHKVVMNRSRGRQSVFTTIRRGRQSVFTIGLDGRQSVVTIGLHGRTKVTKGSHTSEEIA
jgi:hypothetical protein